jgi:hypothetical protein
MAIKITDEFMYLRVDGRVLSTARQRDDGWWTVTYWPRLVTRNQAITVLTLEERLAASYGDDDPFVVAWREELLGHG